MCEFETTAQGCRLATSVGGVLTGRETDIITIIIDVPLKPEEALSPTQRQTATDWFDHTLYSRLNDTRSGAIIRAAAWSRPRGSRAICPTVLPKGKHDDQVESTAQMLDWFERGGQEPRDWMWQLYKQAQARDPQPTRPEPLSAMAKRLGIFRPL
jgi:hypothetical protein